MSKKVRPPSQVLVHGQLITLVTRKCKTCDGTFRVMESSQAEYCHTFCESGFKAQKNFDWGYGTKEQSDDPEEMV